MKKLLLSIVFTSILFTAQATSIALNAFEGSKLCNTLTLRLSLPDSLQGKYTYKTEIISDETAKEISVTYRLSNSTTNDTLKEIVTDVNNYFTTIDVNNNLWTVNQQLFINNTPKSIFQLRSGFPFQDCIEYKRQCSDISVYRKSLRSICSNYAYHPKFQSEIKEDSLIVHFKDSTSYSQFTCMAIGIYIKTDSILITNLQEKNYKVFSKQESTIYCFTTPCPNPWITYTYQGMATNNCTPTNPIEGSDLCGNLSYTYAIPDSLINSYSYTVRQIKNDNNKTIELHYHLHPTKTAFNLTHITTDLTYDFKLEPFETNVNWTIINHLYILNNTYPLSEQTFNPFGTCYEVKSECEKVVVYRKSLRDICPSIIITTKPFIDQKGDIIMVDFIDSFKDAEFVCLAAGYQTHTDSIEITTLSNINYRVYLGTKIECVDGVCTTLLPAPLFLDFANLTNCVINGFNQQTKELFIHPNPANNVIILENVQNQVILTNQLGQHVTLKGNGSFSISDLPAGVYIATFELNGKMIKEKVVIQ